ncbi:PfkB family carbohydrate kinase [Aureimonas sp. AU4]|uniref:PfkB family carbohydrate kinase n=1 Tax=Aureimonas sp. AU4 TaxID=1638163 RepID=UPI00078659C1|nr:PfkB family carbohydrate kinase [Aureimonas sp. AU4]
MAVHVVGNVGLDTTFRLARFPEPGETLNASAVTVALGGKGANQALSAQRAGAVTTLWAPLGADAEAEAVRRGVEREAMPTRGLTVLPDTPTDRSTILVDEGGENLIASAVDCARRFDPLASGWLGQAEAGDVLVLQNNLAPQATRAALSRGRPLGLNTVLNASPLGQNEAVPVDLADVVVVNRVEGEALTGEREPGRIATGLLGRGARAAVVTLGSEGAVVQAAGEGEARRHPAEPARAIDTSGAGDVFCGTLAARLSLGEPLDRAVRLAIAAAAVAVTRHGTFGCGPTRAEFQIIETRENA